MNKLLEKNARKKLLMFLQDDVSKGDITTALVKKKNCKAFISLNEKAVVSGLREAAILFNHFNVKSKNLVKEGKLALKGTKVIELSGSNAGVLKAERTALNVLSRMSAVSTACGKARKLLPKGSNTRIALTRKTSPGFNLFDKKAAKAAGCEMHRLNLNEMVLLKENHLLFFEGIKEAVDKARKKTPKGKEIEIEVRSLDEAIKAAKAKPSWIMLDNFSLRNARKAIHAIHGIGNAKIELSGGISLKNLRKFAHLEADRISMGSLTQNAKGIDFSLEIK